MAASRPPFRPDLEGLRGAAVLLVVLYHAGVPGAAGGFVGVDLFFVLSGYFTTRLLVREYAASGSVDVTAFYARRALRLLPALLVVVAATLAAAWWLYAPIDRPAVAAGARAVALGSGNHAFARDAVDYFASGDNPLLHTWSLAVEQQVSLLWPPLFLLLAAAAERRARARGRPDGATRTGDALVRGVGVGVAAAGALSFAAALWLTRTAPSWAFFGTATRVWEFALGGALALALPEVRAPGTDAPNSWAALQLLGLAAVVGAVLTYRGTMPYPGVAALLPAAGAVAVVAGGALAPGSAASRALAAPALRWLGRVSYAWYLWHWPLVTIGAVLEPAIGVGGRLAWSLAALPLAWLTVHAVERPAREGRLARLPASWVAAGAVASCVAVAFAADGLRASAERRARRDDQRAFAAARDDRMAHACWATTVGAPTAPCVFGDTRSATTIALLGDSHAEHWLAALDRLGRERGWKVVAMVRGGCPVADAPELLAARRSGARARACARYREAMLRRIVAARPAAVVLSSWDHYVARDGRASDGHLSAEAWGRGLRRTYARLAAAGIPTAVVRGTPRTGFDVPACLSRRAAGLPFARACAYDRAGARHAAAAAAQTAAARGLPVRFVDMNDAICAAPRCDVVRNGVVVFTDDNHLTASFSRSAAPALGARLTAALAPLGVRLP